MLDAREQLLAEAIDRLGLVSSAGGCLPFGPGDATAGSETELQVAVRGAAGQVDLPRTLAGSDYLANLGAAGGELPSRLRQWLAEAPCGVWENSWVRLQEGLLSRSARQLLQQHLEGSCGPSSATRRSGASAESCQCKPRSDAARFRNRRGLSGELRLPVSYLLRLALNDALARSPASERLVSWSESLADCFLDDNSSPETLSFRPVQVEQGGDGGKRLARETGRRFLLTQLLVEHANNNLGLRADGQEAMVFFSPQPPQRLRQLNGLLSPDMYQELFVSPCLSWREGEAKQDYMRLCHRVLSRSALAAVDRVREAGLLASQLVVLPERSSLCLANNGVHLNLGSRQLEAAQDGGRHGLDQKHEKVLGDLVLKILEHYLPLFVGIYSAAPVRLGFEAFHPERALAFLPHQLGTDHLQRIWSQWKRRARLRRLGRCWTPSGLEGLDRTAAQLGGLRGDLLADGRLLDYPVALLSTERSPALDGRIDNGLRLKQDLEQLGIFDRRLSLYLPWKLRSLNRHGFSGLEGRHYSLFPSLQRDLAGALSLQRLLAAFAVQEVAAGCTHEHIPDHPEVESERRQLLFAGALGLPEVYLRRETRNHYLAQLIAEVPDTRSSRDGNWLRVPMNGLRRALLGRILDLGRATVDALDAQPILADLEQRLEDPSQTAAARLMAGILDTAGARSPWHLQAAEFQQAADTYYRDTLRCIHLRESCTMLSETVAEIPPDLRPAPARRGYPALIRRLERDLPSGHASGDDLYRAIHLAVAAEQRIAQLGLESGQPIEPGACGYPLNGPFEQAS